MSYGRLLMKIVAESGYSSKEIIEECNKRGRKIDKSYLSRLLNGKTNPPSEELSRMMASICNVDERKLVIEAYIDKAPKEIKEAFLSIKLMTYMVATNIFENKLDEKFYEELKEKLQEEPLSDFIISLIDNNTSNMNVYSNSLEYIQQDNNSMFKLSLEEPLALPVTDNSMFPKMIEGSKMILKLQEKYEDGDILAIKPKNEENIIARIALIKENEITLIPMDKNYKKLIYNLDNITILGKVTKVITDI